MQGLAVTDTDPRCCERRMQLIGIEDADGAELHTYQCDTCGKFDARKAERADDRSESDKRRH
jgi:hypothetical protein